MSGLIGARLTSLSEGKSVLEVPIREEVLQQNGYVHGGVISYIADNALTFAGGSVLGPAVLTSEYKINYLRPASGETLVARASVVNAGRNTDRSDWRLVLKEGRGACSTKHALLAELARENGRHVALMLGIYEMCEDNTPGIGAVLERHGLPCIPDAHCYLAHEGARVDLTREVEGAEYIERFLHEEEIYPRQIGEYKVRAHRGFVRRWAMERGWDPERVWRVRERCIAALERRPRIEQRVKEAGKTNLTMTSLSHGRSQGGADCS